MEDVLDGNSLLQGSQIDSTLILTGGLEVRLAWPQEAPTIPYP